VVIALGAFGSWLREIDTAKTAAEGTALAWTATDLLVERLQGRIKVWSGDQEAYVQLGGAYLQKARETGDPAYYARAEGTLLKALELKPNSNSAMNALGALALGRHQFQEAAEWARRSLEINPAVANTYGILGDAQVELGQYAAAIETFQTMVDLKPNLNSYARVSYARELMGDLEGAIAAMKMAVPPGASETESAAWALTQLGNLYFNTRRVDEAAKQYEAALRAFNGYHLALTALGKVRAAQGRYAEAIDLYQQAVAIIPQPSTLAALGDLYAKIGKPAEAQLQYDTVEFIARLAAINQQIYNRELSLFYSDHDIKLEEALALATREMAVRQDIYGHDALAWALYKNNRLDEAAAGMAEAMKLGTQDANLYYHAGMIHYRLGQPERAREYLEHALALNPHFSLLQSDRAKETIAELGGGK
jgi:tetratricopeptide (TPR) repeat protein